MNNLLMEKMIATVLGTVVFALIGCFAKIPTGVDLIYIYLQYALLCFVAGKYGAVPGLLCGGMGHFLIDLYGADHIWWSWVLGSAIIGFSIGYFTKKFNVEIENIDKEVRRQNRKKCALINVCSQVPVWCLLVPVLNIIFYNLTPGQAFLQGFYAVLTDCLTSVALCDLLLFAYDHVIVRRFIAIVVIVNSLILISYGNFRIESILVYAAAIIISMFVFGRETMGKITKKGPGKYLKTALIFVTSFFLISFLFIGVTAHIGEPTGQEQYMIVLGAGLNGRHPSKILQYRLDEACEYAEEHPDVTIIASGGRGHDEVISEGEAMKNYLVECGISEDRIISETNSGTTEENFAFSFNIINEIEGDAADVSIIYVTNDYHCFRAGIYAEMAGFSDVHPLAAKTPPALLLQCYFRETFSLMKLAVKQILIKIQ